MTTPARAAILTFLALIGASLFLASAQNAPPAKSGSPPPTAEQDALSAAARQIDAALGSNPTPPVTRPVKATQPAIPAAAARPAVYLWTGQGATRFAVGAPVIGVSTWHWGKSDPTKASALTLGGILKAAEAKGYAAPIAVDEGWSPDQAVVAIDSAGALATRMGMDPSRLKWAWYNVPPNENWWIIEAGPGNAFYDKWMKDLDAFPDHPLAARLWALCPQLYAYDRGVTPAAWNKYADNALPILRAVAQKTGKPLIPVISPHTANHDADHVTVFGREMMLAMLDRLVNKERLSVIVWMDPAQKIKEPLEAVAEFEQRRAPAPR
jgi:hypothetical protein